MKIDYWWMFLILGFYFDLTAAVWCYSGIVRFFVFLFIIKLAATDVLVISGHGELYLEPLSSENNFHFLEKIAVDWSHYGGHYMCIGMGL